MSLEITLNGEHVDVEASTVESLLDERGIPTRGVAVAIDGAVVSRSAWASTTLLAGMRIEVLTAAAGG